MMATVDNVYIKNAREWHHPALRQPVMKFGMLVLGENGIIHQA